jgi:glycosyltransferase involved in cell wall biosynthesis
MACGRPSVSAIITAYNSALFLADAVASIRAQHRPPDEIVIIDDGSTDGTSGIVGSLGTDIRYAWQPNRGEASARNRGIAMAHGEFVAFLDADDVWPPDRLERLLLPLDSKRVDIVCGKARAFSESLPEANRTNPYQNPEGFMMSFGCSVIRRTLFERIGGVDEGMHHCVDLDWFLRCREQSVFILVTDDLVLFYRRHDKNMTRHIDAGRDGLMRTVKQSLDRRRRGQQTAQSLAPWETLGRQRP